MVPAKNTTLEEILAGMRRRIDSANAESPNEDEVVIAQPDFEDPITSLSSSTSETDLYPEIDADTDPDVLAEVDYLTTAKIFTPGTHLQENEAVDDTGIVDGAVEKTIKEPVVKEKNTGETGNNEMLIPVEAVLRPYSEMEQGSFLTRLTLRKLAAAGIGTAVLAGALITSGTGTESDSKGTNSSRTALQTPGTAGNQSVPNVDLTSPDCADPVAIIEGAMVGDVMVPFVVKGSSAALKVQFKDEKGERHYPQIDSKMAATVGFCIPTAEGKEQPIGEASVDGTSIVVDRSKFAFNTIIPTNLPCDKNKPQYACVSGISEKSYKNMKPKLTSDEYKRLRPLVVPEKNDSKQAKLFATYASMALVRQVPDYIDYVYKSEKFTNVWDAAVQELMKKQAPGANIVFDGAYQNPKTDFRAAHKGLSDNTFGWVEMAKGSASITDVTSETQTSNATKVAGREK